MPVNFKTFGRLPGRPSRLIAIALEEVEYIEKLPKFQVQMAEWIAKDEATGDCAVCFAGAVMVMRLGAKMGKHTSIHNFPHEKCALKAIDLLRCGEVTSALGFLGLPREWGAQFDREIVSYDEDSSLCKAQLRELKDKLLKMGM